MRLDTRALVAVTTVVTTIVAVTIPPVSTSAAGRNEPVFGDVNGDGRQDRIHLGNVYPGHCSVIVQYGTGDGGFSTPVAYVYLRPGGSGPEIPCPDLGVALDLQTDGKDDLIVAWFAGPPPGIDYTLLVLDGNFQPSFGLTEAVFAPSYLGTADFNGDGRTDAYALTDQGQGFESYFSLGDGTLTVAPQRWCASFIDDLILKDFNRDGALGAVAAYQYGCTDWANGVVKVSHDGAIQHLQHDPTGEHRWEIKLVYADNDSWTDIRTRDLTTGQIDHFIQEPTSGFGDFVKSPSARQDKITIPRRATEIRILDNDYTTTDARLTITTGPTHGTARTTSSRTIIYTPTSTTATTDRLVYRLTEGTKTSSAAVNISITR